MTHFKLTILISLFSFCPFLHAQDQIVFSAYKHRDFYKPFVSEVSSTLTNLSLCQAYSNGLDGNSLKEQIVNEVHLGMDMPLMYLVTPHFKWAMSLPVSVHMVWSPFEQKTSTVLNTDYRFGLSLTGFTTFDNPYLKNLSFKLTPFAHESTHLGDEITIDGVQNDENFFRVNVSYEYYELGLTLNDPELLDENTFSCRIGFMGLFRPDVGYYTFYDNEIGDNILYSSQRWGEYYMQLNYKRTEGFLSNKQWHPNFSVELRNRIQYNFKLDAKEERIWCVNAYMGYNYVPKKVNAIKAVGHYIRYYNGVTPHGQFRNGTSLFVGYSILFYL